jgi:hypothetical protein
VHELNHEHYIYTGVCKNSTTSTIHSRPPPRLSLALRGWRRRRGRERKSRRRRRRRHKF